MKKIKEYFLCIFGSLLVTVGIYFFKFPNSFSMGGVSGISVILSNYFHVSSAGTVTTVINSVILIFGFVFLGKSCGIKTIIGTATLSGGLMLLERFVPLNAPLTTQPLLELVYAVLLPAIGSAILFQCDGTTGGTDIVAMILKKHTSLDIGTALFLSDIVITCGAFLFSIEIGLFSVLGLITKTLVVDSVIENFNLCKCFTLVTSHPDEITEYITKELKRSSTIIPATGGYSHTHTHVILTTMRRTQAMRLRKYLKKNYPLTFMYITNSSEVIGKGFRGI